MSEWYEYDDGFVAVDGAYCVRETERALLVGMHEEEDFWVPKSQIHDDSEVWQASTDGTLIVQRWLAEQNGWL